MTAKIYEIAFKIAGKMTSEFSKSFKAANNAVNGFSRELDELNKKASNIDKVVKLRKETALSARAYLQAKEEAEKLGRALGATGKPTQEMIAKYNNAKLATDKARKALEKKRAALKEVELTAETTGTSLKTLINRQNELKTATDKTRASQEKFMQNQKKIARITEQQQKIAGMQSGLKSGAMSSAGSLAGMAAAATGTVGLPVKEAMAMEDAMAEVRKVTDYTPEGLEKAREELEKMSMRIPFTADGLAQIMAAAAQSGIAQKDLLGFTEQAAKMGVAFDITAEEAGTMMAKWQSGMGLTMEKTFELADAVNALSNENAATASQVGEVLKRYGALGKVAGLTEKETAAFAASVVASGAESEVAATGIKAFMRAMGKGGSMSAKQSAAFGNVGLDPMQLQKNLQKDAPAAIIETLEAIQKKIPKEQWNQYLSVMFGEEAAVAVGPMMQNLDGLKKNFETVADSANYTDSMLKEFESRASTTSNALTLAKNAASYAARALGQPLLGPLKSLAAEFVKNAATAGNWIKNNQSLVMSILKIGGVVFTAIAGFHALRLVLFFLISPVLSLYRGVLLLRKGYLLLRSGTVLATAAMYAQKVAMIAGKVAMLAWRGAMLVTQAVLKGMRVAMWLLNAAMLANPIGLIIAAFAALVAIGVLVWKNWDTIKAKAVEMWNTFAEKFPAMAAFFTESFGRIKALAMAVRDNFKNLISFVKNVFTGNWAAAWENVKSIFGNVFSSLVGLVKSPFNAIISLVNSVIGSINGISVDVPDWVPGLGGKTFGLSIPKIPQLADGGIATRSTLANIGEGREPEAVLPLSKLDSMLGGTSGGGISVNFAPTINISGGGNSDVYAEVKRGLAEGQRNLKNELEKLLANQRRLSYT